MTVEYQRVAHDSMGEAVGRFLGVFYADNSMVVSRESEWLQHSMNVLVGLFLWHGLTAKFSKSRMMMYQPGALSSGMSEEAKALK